MSEQTISRNINTKGAASEGSERNEEHAVGIPRKRDYSCIMAKA